MMKLPALTEENLSDIQIELEGRLASLNVTEKDILRTQLLIEEIFLRMINYGHAAQIDIQIIRQIFDKIQIRMTAEGGAYNPLVEVTDFEALEVDWIALLRKIDCAAHVAYLLYGYTLVKKLCKSCENVLAHTIGEDIRSRIDEHATSDTVIPIVVVRKAAKRRLKSAYDDRYITVRLSYSVAVNDNGAVRSFAHLSARGVVIVGALFLRNGIVRDHRVDITRSDEEAEPWTSEALEILAGSEVGLGEDSHSEPLRLKHARDDRHAKGRVINVSVARYVYKIDLRPVSGSDVIHADRKKCCSVHHMYFLSLIF